jgi:hypothetical protein
MQPVSKQWIGKHASTTIALLLETAFYIRSVQNSYKEENLGQPVQLSSAREVEKRWLSNSVEV